MIEIAFNRAMMSDFNSSMILQSMVLPPSVQERLSRTSFILEEDCYFVEYLYNKRGNATLSLFQDETGYECYVNHFHVDDYHGEDKVMACVKLCVVMSERWRTTEFGWLPLRQIVSFDGASWAYRCHVVRNGQSWHPHDLDQYEDPVMVFDMRFG